MPPSAAVDRALAIDHIVKHIIDYAERPALARLMRVSKRLYMMVARPLYHTVAISEETINSFVEGLITVGVCQCGKCEERFFQHYKVDRKLRETMKGDPTKFRKVRLSRLVDNKDALKDLEKEKRGISQAKAGSTSSTDPKAASSNHHDGESPLSKPVLPISKTVLLSYVGVISVGSHHESACDSFGELLGKHLTDLDVLRIVHTPVHWAFCAQMCEHIPQGQCALVTCLKPRKIVLHNIGGLHIPFPPKWSLHEKTKEVVIILSTLRDRYAGMNVRLDLLSE
jgi:hypothetical protein